MKCKYCGRVFKNQSVCPGCGAPVSEEEKATLEEKLNDGFDKLFKKRDVEGGYSLKRKSIYLILGLLFGTLGIHNFYIGKTRSAVAQLLLTTVGSFIIVGPIISGIWSFVEVLINIFNQDFKDNQGKVIDW